jgi:hypothetical protein
MNGYFSRIARQSGARIAGVTRSRAGEPTATTESHALPIDHEETVMVPPVDSSDVHASKPVAAEIDAAVPKKTSPEKTFEKTAYAIDAETKRPLDPAREERRLIKPEGTRDSSQAIQAPAKKILPDSQTVTTPAKKSTASRFFEKTAEIVEGETAQPEAVQSIVLREVQEWIAAAQPAPSDVSSDATDSALEPLDASSQARERQPGTVRIVENRRMQPAPREVREVSTTDFSEQHFELSIGSIHVVVEGEEKPPAPEPAPIAAPPAARETPRRMSQLSRHYL